MKKLWIVLGVIMLSVVGIAAGTAQASGRFSVGDSAGRALISDGETIDGSWYAAGSQITLKGTVDGDVYCAGQYVTISGQVKGDVLCAAQQITIGKGAVIDGDVRLAGQNIVLEDTSLVSGNMSAFGQSVTIDKGATVERDVNGAAQEIIVDGTIGRDLAFGADRLVLSGTIGRDVDMALSGIDFKSSAEIKGNLNYSSQRELSIPGEVVGGKTSWHEVTEPRDGSEDIGARSRALVALAVIVFVVTIALLLPRFISGTAETNRRQPGKVLLAGLIAFGAMIALPIIVVVLMLSIVGALLAPLVVIIWLALLFMMLPLFSYYIGRLLVGDSIKNVILVSLFGAVVTLIALNLPFIGALTGLAILLIGGGLAVLWLQDTYRTPSYRPVESAKKIAKK